MKTVLVVDDERNIVELVRLYLEQAGFGVVDARDGPTALELHDRVDPDLIVLDLMLPGMDGMEVTREVRRRGETPILMLTARGEDIDRIVGLEVGRGRLPDEAVQPSRDGRARQGHPASSRSGPPCGASDGRREPARRPQAS